MHAEKIWQGIQNFAQDETGAGFNPEIFATMDPVQAVLALSIVGTLGYAVFFYEPPQATANSSSSLKVLMEPGGEDGCPFLGVAKTSQNTLVHLANAALDGIPENTFVLTLGSKSKTGEVLVDYVSGSVKKGEISPANLGDQQCFKQIDWNSQAAQVEFLATQTYNSQPAFIFPGKTKGDELISVGQTNINLSIENKMATPFVIFPQKMGLWLDYLSADKLRENINFSIICEDCESMAYGSKNAVGLIGKTAENSYELRLAGQFLQKASREKQTEVGLHELGHFVSAVNGNMRDDHDTAGGWVNLTVLAKGTNFPGPIFVASPN